jgi:hypothetical protein
MRAFDRFRIRELELEHRAEVARGRRAADVAARDLAGVRAELQDATGCSSTRGTFRRLSAIASASRSTKPAGERSS